jgi:hypothetical protein
VDVLGGPLLNPENGHAYYLLDSNTWTNSETWAEELGGHLATIRNPSESSWVYGSFSDYGGIGRSLWIGLYDPSQDTNCVDDAAACCYCAGGGQIFPILQGVDCPSGSAPRCDYGDPCHSNNFVWVSGEPVSYKNWSANQPDNCGYSGGQPSGEYYGRISGWSIDPPAALGCWNDGSVDWEPTYGVVEVTNFNSFIISPDIYYLPEQSLDTFAHKNAGGTWTLEIQDDRAGASLNAQLVSWQLRFTFTTPATAVLNTNSTSASLIPAGGIVYYLIKVPDSASFATNTLLSATGPLNVWFNSTNPPVGTNPPDFALMSGVTNDSVTLYAGSTPPLPPPPVTGRSYYLGVQNTSGSDVSYNLNVNFDDATRTWSAFPISSAAMTSRGAKLQWEALAGTRFQVEWATNISSPIVWTTNADIITSTDGTFTFTDPGSTNSSRRFYRLLQVQ